MNKFSVGDIVIATNSNFDEGIEISDPCYKLNNANYIDIDYCLCRLKNGCTVVMLTEGLILKKYKIREESLNDILKQDNGQRNDKRISFRKDGRIS